MDQNQEENLEASQEEVVLETPAVEAGTVADAVVGTEEAEVQAEEVVEEQTESTPEVEE